jgi:Na+/melibiose symporter-like transporter
LETRGLAVAIYLVIVNVIAGFGALLMGLISDHLSSARGSASLGHAMLWVAVPFSFWSALHFWLGSRQVAVDSDLIVEGKFRQGA